VSGARSRRKGDEYERDVVSYLNSVGLPVRRAKRGNDSGDILGAPDLVLECKNQKQFQLASWVDQMLIEKQASEATFGVVIAKRPRRINVAQHYFVMTVEDGLALLDQAGVIALRGPDGA
jgi:hypothetical protein